MSSVAAPRTALPYQGELPPPLPLPPLQQTLERYLNAIKAVISKKKYEATEKLVSSFGEDGGEGEFLQNKLTEIASTKDNWVYDWWLDDMYLKNRLALPINSNPGMVFPMQNFKDMDDLLRFAAHFVNGILDYKDLLERQEISLDKVKGKPLCMAQYYRLLTTCRIPGPGKDSQLSIDNSEARQNEHILVIYKRKYYIIDLTVEGERVSPSVIFSSLQKVVQRADSDPIDGDLVGILTGDQRDRWARARSRMQEDTINKQSLELIETSLFVICIDEPLPISFNHRLSVYQTKKKQRDDVSKAMQMLYGGGSKFNSGNRWFDQTLQIILSPDGVCGICYEHSPAEGIVVIQLMEKLIQEYTNSHHSRDCHSQTTIAEPRRVFWKISNDIKEAISTASHSLDKLGEDLDFYVLRFHEYGREFPKNNNVSPDAFIQLALQLTFYKVHRKLVSTYESASTRRFRLGRVDNIRAATPEALKWVRSMCGDETATDAEKKKLFQEAVAHQTEIMLYNIMGQGIDNHLLGLRELSEDLCRPTPKLFTDDSYKDFLHFALSTSQVPTVTDSFMGYGPVVPNGYGASYNPHSEDIVFCISSFYRDDDTNSELFAMSLESTLLQMKELLEKRLDEVEDSAGQTKLNTHKSSFEPAKETKVST